MLCRKFDPDFEWRLKTGAARRAKRDPRPVGAGNDTAEDEAAIRAASQGLHHLARVVHKLHQPPAHGLQGFAPEGPYRSSDLYPGSECGRLSFDEPRTVRCKTKGLGPLAQHQIDPGDLVMLRGKLDPDFEWRLKAGAARRA